MRAMCLLVLVCGCGFQSPGAVEKDDGKVRVSGQVVHFGPTAEGLFKPDSVTQGEAIIGLRSANGQEAFCIFPEKMSEDTRRRLFAASEKGGHLTIRGKVKSKNDNLTVLSDCELVR